MTPEERAATEANEALALWRRGPAAIAKRIKALEARVAELERRLGGKVGGLDGLPRMRAYFENGKAMFGGRGGGGQG